MIVLGVIARRRCSSTTTHCRGNGMYDLIAMVHKHASNTKDQHLRSTIARNSETYGKVQCCARVISASTSCTAHDSDAKFEILFALLKRARTTEINCCCATLASDSLSASAICMPLLLPLLAPPSARCNVTCSKRAASCGQACSRASMAARKASSAVMSNQRTNQSAGQSINRLIDSTTRTEKQSVGERG
jgi:hypothetical protein